MDKQVGGAINLKVTTQGLVRLLLLTIDLVGGGVLQVVPNRCKGRVCLIGIPLNGNKLRAALAVSLWDFSNDRWPYPHSP